MNDKYIKANDILIEFKNMCDGVPASGMYIATLENIINKHAIDKAVWVKETTEDGVEAYHCSACKKCYYIKIPKANYCPQCGIPIERGENENNG